MDSAAARFLQEARKYPLLSAEEEIALARAWRERRDQPAASRLVAAHFRMIARAATDYRGYGLPLSDLISEGNLGMMKALERFDPDRGCRFSTYARWWVRAAIQDYILRSWSIVGISRALPHKRLFFRQQQLRRAVDAADSGPLRPEQISRIAQMTATSESDVAQLDQRLLAPDQSLNAPLRRDQQDGIERQDVLPDNRELPDTSLATLEERRHRSERLAHALTHLTKRERQIFIARTLRDQKPTFRELSQAHAVSGERARQIHAQVIEKLRHHLAKETDT